jgi:hypothetical protein
MLWASRKRARRLNEAPGAHVAAVDRLSVEGRPSGALWTAADAISDRVYSALASVLPHGDEARGRAQHVALRAHSGRVDRSGRLLDKAVELATRAVKP